MNFIILIRKPVVGLREGSWLEVKGDSVKLKGNLTARILKRNETPIEVAPETELNELNKKPCNCKAFLWSGRRGSNCDNQLEGWSSTN